MTYSNSFPIKIIEIIPNCPPTPVFIKNNQKKVNIKTIHWITDEVPTIILIEEQDGFKYLYKSVLVKSMLAKFRTPKK